MTAQKPASFPPRLSVAMSGVVESVSVSVAVVKSGSWVARKEDVVVPVQGMCVCEMGWNKERKECS